MQNALTNAVRFLLSRKPDVLYLESIRVTRKGE
jgi:hypothetical protein